jgi:hypothetical protein
LYGRIPSTHHRKFRPQAAHNQHQFNLNRVRKMIFANNKNDMPPIDSGGSSDIGGRDVPHNDSVNSVPSSEDGGFDDAGSGPTRPGIPGFLEPHGPDLLF